MQQKFLEKTLGQQIADMAAKYPDDNMIDYTDRDYSRTWKEFNDECETIARGFMALGLKKGSHISIWGTNVPAWLLTFFGSAKMGGILVTVNTSYKVFELDYQLKQSDSEAIVLIDGYKGTSYIDIINELCPELESCEPGKLKSRRLPLLKSVIYAGEGECPAAWSTGKISILSLSRLRSRSSRRCATRATATRSSISSIPPARRDFPRALCSPTTTFSTTARR